MKRLIFVLNVDGDVGSILPDLFRFIFRRSTFPCNLCKLTYKDFGSAKSWKEFIETLACKVTFAHRDDFTASYPQFSDDKFPAVFTEGETVEKLISATEIDGLTKLEDLINLVRTKLEKTEIKIHDKEHIVHQPYSIIFPSHLKKA